MNGHNFTAAVPRIFQLLGLCFLLGLLPLKGQAENFDVSSFQNCSKIGACPFKAESEGSGSDEVPTNCSEPVADFDFVGGGCNAPCQVTFTNRSQHATSYNWDFGDGTSSTDSNPAHVYQLPGTYAVTLTASGTGGQDVISKFIIIDDVVDN